MEFHCANSYETKDGTRLSGSLNRINSSLDEVSKENFEIAAFNKQHLNPAGEFHVNLLILTKAAKLLLEIILRVSKFRCTRKGNCNFMY